jgi:drug/metabolite transporter (DMT)-like permease
LKNKKVLGSTLLFITAFVWGVAFVFQRTGMEHIGPASFMAARCVLAVIALGIVLIFAKGPVKAFKFNKATIKGGMICGVLLTLANNLQQTGMVYTTAGKGGFITALYIILVPLGNWLFFRKKPRPLVLAAIFLGAAGLYLLSVKDNFTVTKGDFFVMLCAIVFTGHILVTDRMVDKVDPVQMSFLQFVVCALLGWIWAFIAEEPTLTSIIEARVAIAYCGVISAGVGYTCQIVGQKYTEPATASLIMSLEALFAALSGWLLLQETMSGRELIGCAIMFIAIILVETKQE